MDESAHHTHELTRLEAELAAIVRQYDRAVKACDHMAQHVEAEAVCDRVRRLLHHHLGLRVGISSHDWVWLDGQEDDCIVERVGPVELRTAGRLICSLAEGPLRRWTEPFAASITHSRTAPELSSYTIWFANRTTMLDLEPIRQLPPGSEIVNPPHPPAPTREDGWAFVFRMGDRRPAE